MGGGFVSEGGGVGRIATSSAWAVGSCVRAVDKSVLELRDVQ